MAKQIHFIVVADLDSESWWIDDETFLARFANYEGTWDTELEQWEPTSWEDNLKALEILNKARES